MDYTQCTPKKTISTHGKILLPWVLCPFLIILLILFAFSTIIHSTQYTSESREVLMKYLSIKEMSEKWGISTRRIQILCKEGRIPGIIMIGRTWGIPEDAEKPADARVKSGKYRKTQ